MIYPRLLDSVFLPDGTYDISHGGIGFLVDAKSCEVAEELNGDYSLSMTYMVGGLHEKELVAGRVIVCKPSPDQKEQPFIINSVEKTTSEISVHAYHISRQMERIFVLPFASLSSAEFVTDMMSNAAGNVFNVKEYLNQNAGFSFLDGEPRSMMSLLFDDGDENRSFRDIYGIYGCELTFDGLDVKINQTRAVKSNIPLVYGRNLLEVTQKVNNYSPPKSFLPFWHGDRLVTLSGDPLIYVGEKGDFSETELLDMTPYFDEEPTEVNLEGRSKAFASAKAKAKIGQTITAVPSFELNDLLVLGDTALVTIEQFGLLKKEMKINKIFYDVLKNQVTQIILGDLPKSLVQKIIKLTRG